MQLQEILKQVEDDARGVVVPLFKRDGTPYRGADGKQSTITGYGTESKEYQERRDAVYRLAAEEGREEPPAVTRRAVAAAAVIGWSGIEDADDQPIAVTVDHAQQLFRVEHVLHQFENGIARRSVFFSDGSGA